MNFPQDGIKLHRGNFTAIGRQIQPYLEDGKCFRMVLKPWRERRSLSQNALSHMWYSEISEYLISKGKTFATPAWVSASSSACHGLLIITVITPLPTKPSATKMPEN